MRPRGQTPRMPPTTRPATPTRRRFNEAAGADPADADKLAEGICCSVFRFNEAAGADPADAPASCPATRLRRDRFNEAAGADPADAYIADMLFPIVPVQLQ